MSVRERLDALGIQLPAAATPAGVYVPAKRVGNLVYVSGQVPMKDGRPIAMGSVPSQCSIDDAKNAARQCVINALAAVSTLPGGVDQLVGVARVGAFIASDPDFHHQPFIANGASELLIEIFGESGRHARAAVGTNVLPLNTAVEVEFIFEAR